MSVLSYFPSSKRHSQLSGKQFTPTIWYRAYNMTSTLLRRHEFEFDSVLARSIAFANHTAQVDKLKTSASSASSPEFTSPAAGNKSNFVPKEIPDEAHWKKLCSAIVQKHPQFSRYGATLMMDQLVRSLGGRLLFEHIYAENKEEIERFVVHEPIFVIGIPRSNASMASHINSRSGHFNSFRPRDAMFPGVPSELERRHLGKKVFLNGTRVLPQLLSVFHMDPEMPDTDLPLHLMSSRSLAWGMMHGLPEYLYECLDEDQEHVFDFLHRVMKVFQWYRQMGEFTDCVKKEHNEIWRPEEQVGLGRKIQMEKKPWLIHSPYALLHIAKLHKVFPDMRLMWCHRAISQCVSSMCASLAIHQSVYMGRSLTPTELGSIGEQVCGIFGSGSEQAVDYLANFPYERMVHWHNRDISRSGIRLFTKTLEVFNIESDRFRLHQAIDGISEWNGAYRPKLWSELIHFGLHEGIVGEYFAAYADQFPKFAHEPKFGMKLESYPFMSTDWDKRRFVSKQGKRQELQTSFTDLQPPGKQSLLDPQNQTRDGKHRPLSPHE